MSSRRQMLMQTLATSSAWALAPRASRAAAEPGTPGRTALVIGNYRYRHNPLNSAANDARSVAGLLGRAGFTVDLKVNATREEMKGAILAFGQAMGERAVGTGLFFYAGHAAQLDWRNYLLPVDGKVEAAGDIRDQCVDLGLLIDSLGRAKGKTALIFLDACRDDPFGPRVRPVHKGMGPYDAPAGTLLAFATSPGRVAVEQVGRHNGLYTEHLLRELAVPGVPLEAALKRVRANVVEASRGEQVPWESTSLDSDIYLFPSPRRSAAELEREIVEELQTWNRIKASTNPADWADSQLPNQVNPAELQLGRKWSSRFEQSGVVSGTGEYSFRITGRETVVVPAGEFSAFRVQGDGWFMEPFKGNRGVQLTRWMVPGLNLPVRQEFLGSGLARVLVSARQAVSA